MAAPEIESLFKDLAATLRTDQTAPLFLTGETVYIYGAGNVGKDVQRVLANHGHQAAGFLDRNAKPGTKGQGLPILTPDDASLTREQRARAHIVVGIFNRDTEMPPIYELLRQLGYGRVTSFLELHDSFPSELGDRFWLTDRDFYSSQKEQISAGDDLWSDETSRQIYRAILKCRLAKAYEFLTPPDFTDQYFPKGLPPWPQPVRFVDCGAYDGDTLRVLLDGRTKVSAVAAFEPDPQNFPKLVDSVRARSQAVSEALCLFPCGVSSQTTQLRFSSGQGSASCASETGDTVIQCVSLDEALPVFQPTVIKMDIEGAEYDALLGARGLIEKHRPGLAISVYHRADHLWTIPLLAQSWLRGGRHYLRMHAHNGFELIYYWMPQGGDFRLDG